jgi:PilZ domain
MEHRLNARECLAFSVMLYQCGLPTLCGTSADISRGGLFVRTGFVRWRANECFEVELRGTQGRTFRAPAVVIHGHENGVGLMFHELSERQALELEQLSATGRAALSCGVAA